ncbi:MAG: CopG family transcriptional regulator [Ruminiclostridium sp.]|nr:CopG family transcriptional regulator [Ruminiclostridium sp.]
MLSVRIPEELEAKIETITKEKNISKSEVVKEALMLYIAKNEKSSYELGKNLFGKYGSGDGNLSKTYKLKIKEHIREKNTR